MSTKPSRRGGAQPPPAMPSRRPVPAPAPTPSAAPPRQEGAGFAAYGASQLGKRDEGQAGGDKGAQLPRRFAAFVQLRAVGTPPPFPSPPPARTRVKQNPTPVPLPSPSDPFSPPGEQRQSCRVGTTSRIPPPPPPPSHHITQALEHVKRSKCSIVLSVVNQRYNSPLVK